MCYPDGMGGPRTLCLCNLSICKSSWPLLKDSHTNYHALGLYKSAQRRGQTDRTYAGLRLHKMAKLSGNFNRGENGKCRVRAPYALLFPIVMKPGHRIDLQVTSDPDHNIEMLRFQPNSL